MKLVIQTFPYPLICLEQTESTNEYLRQLCSISDERPEEFTTVTAEYQTAGKGQRGNSWESEAGQNLLFSTLLYPTFCLVRNQFILSQLVSIAVQEELAAWSDEISIKWPNDIYWREKKMGGMLLENNLNGSYMIRSIVGIGLNINQDCFRGNAPNPISLKQITGREHDRQEILIGILHRIESYYVQLRTGTIPSFPAILSERYNQLLFRRIGYHSYQDSKGLFRARLLEVESDGRLLLEDLQGKERGYLFKEVQFVL